MMDPVAAPVAAADDAGHNASLDLHGPHEFRNHESHRGRQDLYHDESPSHIPRAVGSDEASPQEEERDPFSADIGFFTFDEDNLIPSKLSWHGSQADVFNSSISIQRDGDDPSSSIYSKATISDSKITVSRALVVSQPSNKERISAQNQKQKIFGTSSARSSSTSLSRTWSNIRKTTKRGRSVPSPPKIDVLPADPSSYDASFPASPTIENIISKDTSTSKIENSTDVPVDSTKRPFALRKKSTKTSLVASIGFAGSDSPPSAPSPRARPGTPMLSDPLKESKPSIRAKHAPPTTTVKDLNRYPKNAPKMTKLKDELWTVFKTLDNDYQKFQSKPSALKVSSIKTSLLPFLRSYVDHPSNNQLRPEDLDRRVVILDKWWSAVLVILNSRNNQTVSGADRPLLLDAVSAIMDRPEWKCPLARADSEAWSDSDATGGSGDSGFFVDSVLHNVRTLFVKNLFTQVAMAVERMSMRHAPASLVSFCGKALAYAFFYCNGVADILVRLWETSPKLIKQVVTACQAPKQSGLAELSSEICSMFPRPVHGLAFKSYRNLMASLKQKPAMPLGFEKVQWHGQWLSRWKGRDSDLFFSFVKHFHVLMSAFLPLDATSLERSCAPGCVLVQAQLLVNLDSTINRATKSAPLDSTLDTAITFDDLMPEETPSPGFHFAPLNESRLMVENRVIMLMKNVLSSEKMTHTAEALLFARSMSDVVKATVQSTSIFSHSACFILCDFLQEFFSIMIAFEKSGEPEYELIDWPFWLDVFERMLQSQNTMTEIRLYALLYSCWDTLTSNQQRKSALCMDLLLSERMFADSFFHWCPMVRAYYMRLICWRIARFDGDVSKDELEILETLMLRLQGGWRHFKFLVERANSGESSLPSTAPCNPAPGRRLLIIRMDALSGGLAADSNASQVSLTSKSGKDSANSADDNNGSTIFERLASTFEQGNEAAKRRGGMLRSLLSYRGSSPRPEAQGSTQEADGSSIEAVEHDKSPPLETESDRADSRSSMYEQRPVNITNKGTSPATDQAPKYTKASFKFSLEFVDRSPQSTLSDMRLAAPRLPLAAQLLLQSQPNFLADFEACKTNLVFSSWSYVGRALAEWTLVVNECQNFFIRRRNEGVPTNKLVETPTLGVESFKRPG